MIDLQRRWSTYLVDTEAHHISDFRYPLQQLAVAELFSRDHDDFKSQAQVNSQRLGNTACESVMESIERGDLITGELPRLLEGTRRDRTSFRFLAVSLPAGSHA